MSLRARLRRLEKERAKRGEEGPTCPVCGGQGVLRFEIEGGPEPDRSGCPRCGQRLDVRIVEVPNREPGRR